MWPTAFYPSQACVLEHLQNFIFQAWKLKHGSQFPIIFVMKSKGPLPLILILEQFQWWNQQHIEEVTLSNSQHWARSSWVAPFGSWFPGWLIPWEEMSWQGKQVNSSEPMRLAVWNDSLMLVSISHRHCNWTRNSVTSNLMLKHKNHSLWRFHLAPGYTQTARSVEQGHPRIQTSWKTTKLWNVSLQLSHHTIKLEWLR